MLFRSGRSVSSQDKRIQALAGSIMHRDFAEEEDKGFYRYVVGSLEKKLGEKELLARLF